MKFRAALLVLAAVAVVPLSLVAMSWDVWWYVLGIAEAVLLPAGASVWLLVLARRDWRKG